MKIILLEDIKHVGKRDDIINVSNGYARNFLFPKKLAVEATKNNLLKLQTRQISEDHKKDLEVNKFKEQAKQLEGIELILRVKAGDNGKIFGGITSKEISEQLKEQYKIEIDKKKILLKETIKNLGIFVVDIKFGDGIIAKLMLQVQAE